MTRRPRNPGFTLLEVLAATAMVAALAGSLFACLHIAFRARRSALSATDAVRRSSLAMQLAQADLHSACVPNGVLAGAFIGQTSRELAGPGGDMLTFYSTVAERPATVGLGEIKKIEYACELEPEARGLNLVRRVTENLLSPQTLEPRTEVLCRGVRTFTLHYYDGTDWQESYDSTTQNNVLPKAVEMLIEWEPAPDQPAAAPLNQVFFLPCSLGSVAQTITGAP